MSDDGLNPCAAILDRKRGNGEWQLLIKFDHPRLSIDMRDWQIDAVIKLGTYDATWTWPQETPAMLVFLQAGIILKVIGEEFLPKKADTND